MKILVTGGAGFIGSHLCEELSKEHEVISLDNYSTGKKENIEHLDITKIGGDVLDEKLLDKIMPGVDIIYNQMASKKTVCLRDPRQDCDINAKGTLNLLMSAKKHNVRKFIHASTGSVYGENDSLIDEYSHLNPCSYYGVSKLAGERYVDTFSKLYGMDTCILRYFHVYGARQDSSEFGGVVSIFIDKFLKGEDLVIFGNGKQVRSFTYIKDVVKANIEAMNHQGVYNCASGIRVTINELASRIIGYDDIGVVYKPMQLGDIMNFNISNAKISRDFKLRFTDFKTGLDETIRYYKQINKG